MREFTNKVGQAMWMGSNGEKYCMDLSYCCQNGQLLWSSCNARQTNNV